jgi:hypothetical protein
MSSICFAQIDRKGNGGDATAVAFIESAKEILKVMEDKNFDQVDLGALKNAILTTQVESTDEALILDGAAKDAINYPSEKLIVINRKSWGDTQNKLTRMTLSLHEYLGILGMDDSKYLISMSAIKLFGSSIMRCESRFMYRNGIHALIGDVEGSVTIDLSQEDGYGWTDELRSYNIAAGETPEGRYFQIEISPLDNPVDTLEVRSVLNMIKPSFYLKTEVVTKIKRHGGKVLFILVQCG